MNVNDELRDLMQSTLAQAERQNYSAYMLLTLTGKDSACCDCKGDFSALFKTLFTVASGNEAMKGLVLAVAEALRAHEKMRQEQELKQKQQQSNQ